MGVPLCASSQSSPKSSLLMIIFLSAKYQPSLPLSSLESSLIYFACIGFAPPRQVTVTSQGGATPMRNKWIKHDLVFTLVIFHFVVSSPLKTHFFSPSKRPVPPHPTSTSTGSPKPIRWWNLCDVYQLVLQLKETSHRVQVTRMKS